MANLFINIIRRIARNEKKWISMTVDRLYFESQTERYFLILKAAGKHGDQNVFITLGNVLDETILPTLFIRNENTKALFRQLGIQIKRIRILKKMNSPDSAECTLKIGMFLKTIHLSTIEAIRMASEQNQNIEVPQEIIKAERFDLKNQEDAFSTIHNNVFSSKFIERDFYNNQEVIM